MHITIPEAVQLTGKSQATIYRLIKRPESEPYVRIVDGKHTIDKEYLLRVYQLSHRENHENHERENENHHENHENGQAQADRQLFREVIREYPAQILMEKDKRIALLQGEIEVKNKQLEKKDALISDLIDSNKELAVANQSLAERMKELNINHNLLQQQNDRLTKQLPAPDQASNTTNDMIYRAVAIITAIALITFIGAMIYSFVTQ